MANDGIEIPITVDVQGALKQLAALQSEGNKSLQSITDSFSSLGGITASLGGLFAASKIKDFFNEIVEASVHAKEEVERLTNALEQNGEASDEVVRTFQNLATEIEHLTGTSDEAVLAQVTYLKSIGATNSEAEKLIRTAAELSSVTKDDLAVSVDRLVKSYSGSVKELAKQFKGLKEVNPALIEQGAAVDFLAEKLGGTALRNSKNLGTQQKVLTEVIGDFKEVLGDFFTGDSFAKKLQFMTGAIIALTESLQALNRGELTGVAETFVRVAADIGLFLAIVKGIPLALSVASAAVELLQVNLALFKAREGVTFFQSLILGTKAFIAEINLAKLAVIGLKAIMSFGLTIIIDAFITAQLEAKNFTGGLEILARRAGILFLGLAKLISDSFNAIFDGLAKIPKVGKIFEGLSDPKVSKRLEDQITAQRKAIEGLKEVTNSAAEANSHFAESGAGLARSLKNAKHDIAEATTKFKSLQEALNKGGETQGDAARNELKQRLEVIDTAKKYQLASDAEILSIRVKAEREAQLKLQKLREADVKRLSEGNILVNGQASFGEAGGAEGGIALGLGALKDILQGPNGAVAAVSKVIGQISDTLLPGIGGVVSTIAGVLAQGPEAAKQFVVGFVDSIPIIIENIIASIPVVIETLVEKLSEKAGDIAIKLGVSLASQAPFIATKLTVELIKNIPTIVKSMAEGAFKAFSEAFSSFGGLFGGGSGGGGGGGILGAITSPFSAIGDIFGFAGGGKASLQSGDTLLAGFNANETVIDETDTRRLSQFLDRQEMGLGGQSSGPQTIILQIGQTQLAKVIRDLETGGYRLA